LDGSRACQVLGSRQFLFIGLDRRVVAFLELGYPRSIDVEADRRVALTELHLERQPNVPPADHGNPNVLEVAHERTLPKQRLATLYTPPCSDGERRITAARFCEVRRAIPCRRPHLADRPREPLRPASKPLQDYEGGPYSQNATARSPT